MHSKEQKIFFGLASFMLLVNIFLSTKVGVSADEVFQKPIGDYTYKYFSSFGKNDSLLTYLLVPEKGEYTELLNKYGPLVEFIPSVVYNTLHTEPIQTRHFFITLFSFAFFLFCGLTAKELGGWRAGIVGLLFAYFSPRLFGESLNNPKDLPFAAAAITTVYYIIKFSKELPIPSWKTSLKLLLALAFGFSIRSGALLFFAYFFAFIGATIFLNKELREDIIKNMNTLKAFLFRVLFSSIGAWVLTVLIWPAAWKKPIGYPLASLNTFKEFPWNIKVLFDGVNYQSNTLPWYYSIKYIFITTPEIILLGVLLFFLLIKKSLKEYKWLELAFVIGTFLFPLAYIVYSKSPLYTGWRHTYFVYGGFVVIAALGFEILYREVAQKKLGKILVSIILFVGLLFPLKHYIQNAPLYYIYFNSIYGGIDKGYKNYAIDYYCHSAKPMTDWIIKNVPNFDKLKIASNTPWEVKMSFAQQGKDISPAYIRYRERNEQDWDYAILSTQFIDPVVLANDKFAPKGSVYKCEVDGKVVGCVVKRENKNDIIGIDFYKKNQFDSAYTYLYKALQNDPENEIINAYAGMCLLQTNKPNEAMPLFLKAQQISPENMLSKFGLVYAYIATNNTNYAKMILDNLISENPSNPEPYRLYAMISEREGNAAAAQQYSTIYSQLISQK